MVGKLIVLEGGDGAGKATQTKILVDQLKKLGWPTETLDFPSYETVAGQMIKDYLSGRYGDPTKIDPVVASTIYAANRFEKKDQINGWLKAEKLVVLDRYLTANFIHQAAKFDSITEKELMIMKLELLEFQVFGIPRPDLVIYLHVYPEMAQQLMIKRGRRQDGQEKNLDYVRRVEQTAFWCAERFNWQIIECCQDQKNIKTKEEIAEIVWQTIIQYLNKIKSQIWR